MGIGDDFTKREIGMIGAVINIRESEIWSSATITPVAAIAGDLIKNHREDSEEGKILNKICLK